MLGYGRVRCVVVLKSEMCWAMKVRDVLWLGRVIRIEMCWAMEEHKHYVARYMGKKYSAQTLCS